jgi:hypothetical protein
LNSATHATHAQELEDDLEDDIQEAMPPVDDRLSIAPGLVELDGADISMENKTRFR